MYHNKEEVFTWQTQHLLFYLLVGWWNITFETSETKEVIATELPDFLPEYTFAWKFFQAEKYEVQSKELMIKDTLFIVREAPIYFPYRIVDEEEAIHLSRISDGFKTSREIVDEAIRRNNARKGKHKRILHFLVDRNGQIHIIDKKIHDLLEKVSE